MHHNWESQFWSLDGNRSFNRKWCLGINLHNFTIFPQKNLFMNIWFSMIFNRKNNCAESVNERRLCQSCNQNEKHKCNYFTQSIRKREERSFRVGKRFLIAFFPFFFVLLKLKSNHLLSARSVQPRSNKETKKSMMHFTTLFYVCMMNVWALFEVLVSQKYFWDF